MTWNDITVQQFQAILKLRDSDMEEWDKVTEVIAILYNDTPTNIDNLTIAEYNARAEKVGKFLYTTPEGKAPKYIKANGKKYAPMYSFDKFTQRQFSEVVYYNQNMLANIHLILASIVQPVKFGFKRKNKADDHALYADDLLHAPMGEVYGACVFFCKIYSSFLRATGDFLKAEQLLEALVLKDLADSMDGFTTQKN